MTTVKHRLNSEVELYRKQYEGAQIQLSESEAEVERLTELLVSTHGTLDDIGAYDTETYQRIEQYLNGDDN